MRRWSIILMCILMMICMCGCDKASDPGTPGSGPGTASQDSQDSSAGNILADFQATDLQGNTVSNEVFNGYQLTMINIWGTFCGPCIEEMPVIQRLQEEFKDQQVQIIGIVADNKLQEARQITAAQGATYLNLIPDQSLMDNLISRFDYVPVTVFVDSDGRLLTTIVSGARDFESYSKILEGLLDNEG